MLKCRKKRKNAFRCSDCAILFQPLAFSLQPIAPLSALNGMDLVQGKSTLKRKKLIWLLVGTIKSMASGYPATLA
jgi:hypothetical protein